MPQDSPLSMAASIAGLLTFAAAIMFAVYARALSNLNMHIELADMLLEAAMAINDVVTLDNSLKDSYHDRKSLDLMVAMYGLSLDIICSACGICKGSAARQMSSFQKEKQLFKRHLYELDQMRSHAHALREDELSRITKFLFQAMNDLRKTTLDGFEELKCLLATGYDKAETSGASPGQLKHEASRDPSNQETVSGNGDLWPTYLPYTESPPFRIAASSWASRVSKKKLEVLRREFGFSIAVLAPEDLTQILGRLQDVHLQRRSTHYKQRISEFLGL